jgi:hypothetical protein
MEGKGGIIKLVLSHTSSEVRQKENASVSIPPTPTNAHQGNETRKEKASARGTSNCAIM